MPPVPDNFRYFQIRRGDRMGDGKLVDTFGGADSSDFVPGDDAIFNESGALIDGGAPPFDPGAGGYGTPYWQIPVGLMNRQIVDFFLDYIPLTFVSLEGETKVWIELYVNGVLQNNNFHFYIAPGTNHIVMRFPPKASDLPMLAYYFRGIPAFTPPPPGTQPPPVPPPPPPPPPAPPATGIASIDLTVVTAWTRDQNSISSAAIAVNGSRSFATTGLVQNTPGTYPKTTSTYNLATTQNAWLTGDTTTLAAAEAIRIWFFSFSGGAPGTSLSPQADFKVYDAYLTLTYGDGSTFILRPTTAVFELNDGSGSTVNAPPTIQNSNAVDTDSNTYAELLTSAWGPFGQPPALRIEGFAFDSGTTSTPPPTPTATLDIWGDYQGTVNGLPAVSYSLDGGLTWVGGDGTLPGDVGVQI